MSMPTVNSEKSLPSVIVPNTDISLKYEKSNMFIFGRYDMTKMAQKTLAYALSTLRGRRFSEAEMAAGIRVSFTSTDIRMILAGDNRSRNSLARELRKVSATLQGKTVFIEGEKDSSDFVSFTLIKTCRYENDTFTLTFHEEMSRYLVNLDDNFTVLDVLDLRKMCSSYTIRFYELCESFVYQAKAHGGIVKKDFHFVELKLMMGMINSENEKVSEIVKAYGSDYNRIGKKIDEIYAETDRTIRDLSEKIKRAEKSNYSADDKREYIKTLKENRDKQSETISAINKYRNASDFRKKVLDVARNEMTSLLEEGDINVCFDYKTLRKDHCIYGFQLIIMTKEGYQRWKTQQGDKQITIEEYMLSRWGDASESGSLEITSASNQEFLESQYPLAMELQRQNDVIDAVSDMIEENLKTRDLRRIAEAADYDIERIKKAYDILKSQGTDVGNIVGFLLKAIQDGYNSPTSSKAKGRNGFKDFMKQDYDIDEMEKNLLGI